MERKKDNRNRRPVKNNRKAHSGQKVRQTAPSGHSRRDERVSYDAVTNTVDRQQASGMPEHLLVGRNPVMEALKSGRGIEKLLIVSGAEGSVIKIEGMARDRGIDIQYVQRSALDRMTDGAVHQGVAAYVSDFEYCEPEEILRVAEEKREDPFLIILDGIEDPHNLGAIIRTADAAGAHGVIIPKRRAALITPTAEKSAAGAAEYVPVSRVTNLARTIDDLKEAGIWIAAADMDGEEVWGANLTGPIGLVIGNEGHGISRLIREKCDFTVSFPMLGKINSLNASNAAALLMYEVVRQRKKRV